MCAGCTGQKEEWEVHFEKAMQLKESNACGLALEEFDQAIALHPDDPELYIQRGYCHILNKGKEKGKITFHHVDDRIFRIDHYVDEALSYSENIDLDTGEVTIKQYGDYGESGEPKEEWEKEYELTGRYSNKGDHAEAIEHFSKAIELNPGMAMLYTNRAMAYLMSAFNNREVSL